MDTNGFIGGRSFGSVTDSTPPHLRSRSRLLPLVAILLLIVAIAFAVTQFSPSPTGRAVLAVDSVYQMNEPLVGALELNLQSGELIPSDTTVLVSFAGQTASFPLREVTSSPLQQGNFYAIGSSLSGSGSGYGVIGTKKVYPDVSFQLLVSEGGEESGASSEKSSSEKKSTESNASTDTKKSEAESPKSEEKKDTTAEEKKSAETGTPATSSETESPASSPTTSPSASAPAESSSGSSSPSSTSSSTSSSSEGASIETSSTPVTGSAVSSSYIVSGKTSGTQPYTYTIPVGRSVQLVAGSVSVDGKKVSDGLVNMQTRGSDATVTTSYFVDEQGFGSDYSGNKTLILSVPVGRFNLYATESGSLHVEVAHNNASIVGVSKNIVVTGSEANASTGTPVSANASEPVSVVNVTNGTTGVTNATVTNETNVTETPILIPTIHLIQQIPTVSLENGSTELNLSVYFEGAETYTFEATDVAGNISGDSLVLTALGNSSGTRLGHITAFAGNESLVGNDFEIIVGTTSIVVETVRPNRIRVGEPVHWVKNVTLDAPENVTIELPDVADNVTVKSVDEQGEHSIVPEVSINGNVIAGSLLTGDVTANLQLRHEPPVVRLLRQFMTIFTGRAVDEGVLDSENATVEIKLNKRAKKYIVDYDTDAPIAYEKKTPRGKQVVISGPEGLNYTDIESFTDIPELIPVGQENRIRVFWVENDTYVVSNVSDTNGDGTIDHVEWITPHLSNETFNIILITKAEHLNESRDSVEDVYEFVREKDDNWTTVPAGHYLRVTFERNLTSENDITIYARSAGGGSVQAYERDQNEVVADFGQMSTIDQKHQVYLTSFNGSQDTFDLYVSGSDVEFDYAVDPVVCNSGDQSTTCTVNSKQTWDGAFTFNNLVLQNGAIITHSANTNALSFWLNITAYGDITIDSGAFINLTGKGYTNGNGPGPGGCVGSTANGCGGAAHGGNGGLGGGSQGSKGLAYDSSTWPADLGSGGGSSHVDCYGMRGGGLLILNAPVGFISHSGLIKNEGNFRANGAACTSGGGGGGGGGGVLIVADQFSGSGPIAANGSKGRGTSNGGGGGGGGGGRVSIIYGSNSYSGAIDVRGAPGGGGASTGATGSVGTSTTTLDSTPPKLSLIYPTGSTYTSSVTSITYSNGRDATTCQYSTNGGGSYTGVTCGNNVSGLSSGDGTFDWRVRVYDRAGNTVTRTVSFTVDSTAPTASIVYPTATTYNAVITALNVSVGSDAATCKYSTNGAVTNTTFTCGTNITGLNSGTGSVTWRAWAADSLGNEVARSVAFTVNPSPPNVRVVYPTNTTYNSVVSAFNVSVGSDAATCKYSTNDALTNTSVTCGNNVTGLSSIQGANNWTAWAITSGGNENVSRIAFSVDSVYPTIDFTGQTPANNSNGANTFVVNVSYTELNFANITFTLYNNTNTLTIVNSTTFTTAMNFTNFTGLSEGTYFYNATIMDVAGNSNTTELRKYVIDTVAPLVQFVALTEANGTTIDRSNVMINVTGSDATSGLVNITLSVYDSLTGLVNETTISGSPNTVNMTLADGTYYFNATATDLVGNRNATETRMIVISTHDVTSPVVTIVAPANRTYNTGTIDFNVTLNENGSIVAYSIDGGLTNTTMTSSNNNRTFTATSSSLADGSYTFRAYANDSSGNRNDSASIVFRIDATAPVVQFVTPHTPANNSFGANSLAMNVSVTETSFANITYELYNETGGLTLVNRTTLNTSSYFINFTGLTNGRYYYNVSVVDTANNQNVTETRMYTVDTVAPTLSIALPANTTYATAVSALNYSVSDDGSIQACWYSTDSGVTNTTVGCGTNVTGLSSTQGTNIWSVYANDTSGNLRLARVTFFVDSVYPTISFSLTMPSNGTIGSNAFTVNATSVEVNFASITFSLLNASGVVNSTTFTTPKNFTTFTGLADGTYFTNVTIVDVAGNSNTTELRTYTVDTSAPVISIGYPANTSYATSISALNYSVIDARLQACWYSTNGTVTNTTVTCGTNVTGLSASQGTNIWRVYANDSAGNQQAAVVTFFIDSVYPTISFTGQTPSNNTFGGNTFIPNVTFTEANFASITFSLLNAGGVVNSTTFTTATNFTNFTGLADGTYFYNATVTDVAGNSNTTELRTYTVDTTAPTVDYGAGADSDALNMTRNWVYAAVSVTEASEANITFTLSNTAGVVNSTTFTTPVRTMNWTGLADGLYQFNVTVVDLASRATTTSVRSVRIDSVAPSVQFVTPTETDGTNVTRTNIAVNVSGSDSNLQNVVVRLYNSTRVQINSSTTSSGVNAINFTGLVDGTYYFNATANDSAGNVNNTATRQIIIDTHGPTLTIASPANASYVSTSSVALNFSVSDGLTGVNTCSYSLDSQANTSVTCGANATLSVADGVHSARVYADDRAGNVNGFLEVVFTVDTVRPTISYTGQTPSNNTFGANSLALNVSYLESNFANVTFSVSNTSKLVNYTTFTTQKNYTNLTGLADGRYYYNASIVDLAGNRNVTGARTYVVDALFPRVNYSGGMNVAGANVSSKSIFVNASVIEANFVNISFGLWNATRLIDRETFNTPQYSFNFSNLSDGRYTYNVTVTDILNHINTTITRNILLDTTPPQVYNFSNPDVPRMSNVTLMVNAFDALSNISMLYVQVKYPNSTYSTNTMLMPIGMINGSNNTNYTNTQFTTFRYVLPMLPIVGDYVVNYTIMDGVGNYRMFSDVFEVFIPLNMSGNFTNPFQTLQNYSFELYRPGTNMTLYNFSASSYNFTNGEIHMREYDIIARVGDSASGQSVLFQNFNLTTSYVPISMDNFTMGVVNITNYAVLTGMGVNSTFTGDAVVNLSYSGLFNSSDVAVSESGLTIYKCSSWDYSARNCTTSFQPFTTSFVDPDSDRAIANTTSFSSFIITGYTCGNNVCQSNYGETVTTCAADCTVSSGGSSSSTTTAGGGGGGGGGTTTATPLILQSWPGSIEHTLKVGERDAAIISFNNTEDSDLRLSIDVDEQLASVLSFEHKLFIPAHEDARLTVLINGTKEGAYVGSLYVTANGKTTTIPVVIIVKSFVDQLLDVSVVTTQKRVEPGTALNFQVSTFNLGQSPRYDIYYTYDLVHLEDNKTITSFQESVAIQTSLSLARTLTVPADAPLGRYALRVHAAYNNGATTAIASTTFDVGTVSLADRLSERSHYLLFFIIGFAFILSFVALLIGIRYYARSFFSAGVAGR